MKTSSGNTITGEKERAEERERERERSPKKITEYSTLIRDSD